MGHRLFGGLTHLAGGVEGPVFHANIVSEKFTGHFGALPEIAGPEILKSKALYQVPVF
jgi:hypothetical protein